MHPEVYLKCNYFIFYILVSITTLKLINLMYKYMKLPSSSNNYCSFSVTPLLNEEIGTQ